MSRAFFEAAYLWLKRSQQPPPGLQSVWDCQHSVSLMPSRTSLAGKHICLVASLLRWLRRLPSFSQSRHYRKGRYPCSQAALSLRWISVLDLAVSIPHEPADGDCEGNRIAADIEYRIYLERFETYE